MPFNFDEIIERRYSDSLKWTLYEPDVLPLWVADMDFRSPEPILKALHERIDHGLFGYQFDAPGVRKAIVDYVQSHYGWQIAPPDMHFTPNLVSALNFVCLAFAETGDEVLMQTPAYPPFLSAPPNGGRQAITCDLAVVRDGQRLRYEIDFDALEAAITPRTKVFMLCNPHNPVGRMWTRQELEGIAALCLRHNLIISSDEIHCDLVLNGGQHIPIASLAPEVAERCITLMSPSKTFNLPTLGFAFVVATNPDLLKRFVKATDFFVPHPGSMGYVGAQAAYTQCQDWLDALLPYLKANRDYIADYVQEHLPTISVTCPEATYLAWLDWRAVNLPDTPYQFFLKQARVALSDGAIFGKAGEGFTRLNFGAPRATLTEALDRMRAAVNKL